MADLAGLAEVYRGMTVSQRAILFLQRATHLLDNKRWQIRVGHVPIVLCILFRSQRHRSAR